MHTLKTVRLLVSLMLSVSCAFAVTPARAEPDALVTYTVDTATDSNVGGCTLASSDCSLRRAITLVNAGSTSDTYQILFNNNFDINLASALPAITQNNVKIVGFNALNTVTIRVNGGSIAGLNVLDIRGSNVEIDRLRIYGAGSGRSNVILTGDAKNFTLINSVIGAPDATGACPSAPAAARGILIESTGTINVPGGEARAWIWGNMVRCITAGSGIEVNNTDRVYLGSDKAGNRGAAQRNTIDGNSTGVAIRNGAFFNYVRNSTVSNNAIGVSAGLNTINNWVQGNLIEKNAIGLFLVNGAVSTRVGVDLSSINAADGNIIRANTDTGVAINGANTTDNLIFGNVIGRGDPAEPATNGNTNYGILIVEGARTNQIGTGGNALGRNVIGGNGIAGVALLSGANNNLVNGNAIGAVDVDTPVPNGEGVFLSGSNTTTNTVTNNLIARNTKNGVLIDAAQSTTIRDSNKIAFNGQHGVLLINGAKDNTVRNSDIHDNGRHGIALASAGTTRNSIDQVSAYRNAGDGVSEWQDATGNTWSQLSASENGGLGIDKDAGDPNANNLTPPVPTVTGMVPVGLTTYLYGGFASTAGGAGASNKVEVYAVRLDSRGVAQGGMFLGSGNVDMTTGAWSAFVTLPPFAMAPACVVAFQTLKPDAGTPASSSEYGLTNCRTMTPVVMK